MWGSLGDYVGSLQKNLDDAAGLEGEGQQLNSMMNSKRQQEQRSLAPTLQRTTPVNEEVADDDGAVQQHYDNQEQQDHEDTEGPKPSSSSASDQFDQQQQQQRPVADEDDDNENEHGNENDESTQQALNCLDQVVDKEEAVVEEVIPPNVCDSNRSPQTPPPPPQPKQHYHSNTKDFESRLRMLEEEGHALSQQLGKERDRVKTLLSEKRAMEAELATASTRERQWTDSRALMESTEVTLRGTVDRLRHRVEELETDLLQSRREASATSTQRLELSEEVEQLHLSLTTRETEHAEEVRRLRDEIRRVHADAERRQSNLQYELTQAQSRAHSAEMKCVELLRAVSDSAQPLQEQISQYEGMMAPLQDALDKRGTEVAKLKQDKSALATQLELARQSIRELQREVFGLQTEKDAARQEHVQYVEKATLDRDHLNKMLSQKSHALHEAMQTLHNERETWRALLSSQQEQTIKNVVDAAESKAYDVKATTEGTTQPPTTTTIHHHSQGVLTSKVENLERELLRVMNENASVKPIVDELKLLRSKHTALQEKHDMLLQMYGELMEK